MGQALKKPTVIVGEVTFRELHHQPPVHPPRRLVTVSVFNYNCPATDIHTTSLVTPSQTAIKPDESNYNNILLLPIILIMIILGPGDIVFSFCRESCPQRTT